MEESTSATLIAAGIAAIVASLIFVAGELIKLSNGRGALRREAAARVLEALADVAREARRPRLLQAWSMSPIEISIAATHLFPVLEKRDWALVEWLGEIGLQVAEHKSIDDKVRTASMATGIVMLWSMHPRKVRKQILTDVARWSRERSPSS